MSYNFALLICSIIQSIIFLSFVPYGLLNKKHKYDTTYFVFCIILSIVISYTCKFHFVTKTFTIIAFEYFFIKNLYSLNSVISIIISSVSYYIVFIILQLITLVFLKVYNLNMVYIRYYPEKLLHIYFSLLIIIAVLSLIFKTKSFFNEMRDFIFERKSMKFVFFYTMLFILLMAITGSIITDEKPYSKYYNISLFMMSIYMVMNYLYIFQIKKMIKSKNEYNTINNYITRVERTASQLKKQEHEHRNELITIKALAMENNTNQIIELIDNINKNKNVKKTASSIGLEKIHDTILKSLIMHKLNSMDSLGIRVEFFIREIVDPIKISPKDLTNIIGIVLDNAIEATINADDKYISILMDDDSDSNEINITIANSYSEISNIYQNGVSTKGNLRGNGLSILADIEERNDKVRINTEITEELFIQDIFIKK